jgi:hypothetical protein
MPDDKREISEKLWCSKAQVMVSYFNPIVTHLLVEALWNVTSGRLAWSYKDEYKLFGVFGYWLHIGYSFSIRLVNNVFTTRKTHIMWKVTSNMLHYAILFSLRILLMIVLLSLLVLFSYFILTYVLGFWMWVRFVLWIFLLNYGKWGCGWGLFVAFEFWWYHNICVLIL